MEFLKTKEKVWMETKKLEDFLGKAKEFSAIFYVGGFGRKSPLSSSFSMPPNLREEGKADWG
jgi:hypothetical protein